MSREMSGVCSLRPRTGELRLRESCLQRLLPIPRRNKTGLIPNFPARENSIRAENNLNRQAMGFWLRFFSRVQRHARQTAVLRVRRELIPECSGAQDSGTCLLRRGTPQSDLAA